MTKFGMVGLTQMGIEKRVVSRGQLRPILRGGAGAPHAASPDFGTSYMRAHSVRNSNQILRAS